jgi:hypothetical protein
MSSPTGQPSQPVTSRQLGFDAGDGAVQAAGHHVESTVVGTNLKRGMVNANPARPLASCLKDLSGVVASGHFLSPGVALRAGRPRRWRDCLPHTRFPRSRCRAWFARGPAAGVFSNL